MNDRPRWWAYANYPAKQWIMQQEEEIATFQSDLAATRAEMAESKDFNQLLLDCQAELSRARGATHYAWLLEIPGPAYLGEEGGALGWTTDHNKAMRFARKSDAEMYAELDGLTETTAIEHGWDSP